MAVIRMKVMSASLMREVAVDAILPADRIALPGQKLEEPKDFPVLYLLHGVFGSEEDFLCNTCIRRYAEDHGVAVVMPAGENAFYVDDIPRHALYGQWIGEELPALIRRIFPVSSEREKTWIGGISMGGFGALRNGMKYCQTFGHIAAVSSALVLGDIKDMEEDSPFFIRSKSYMRSVFGDLDHVEESDLNPAWLARMRHPEDLPAIHMFCGSEDPLRPANQAFAALLKEQGCVCSYKEQPGGHSWQYWNDRMADIIRLMSERSSAGVSSGNVGLEKR